MANNLLGLAVKDLVSGFKGVATERVEYLNGCIQYRVTPKAKDGVEYVKEWFVDEGQLMVRKRDAEKDELPLRVFSVSLGDHVVDRVSGFVGVVSGISQKMNGEIQVGIRAKCVGEKQESSMIWIEQERVQFAGGNIRDKVAVRRTGGPQADAPPH